LALAMIISGQGHNSVSPATGHQADYAAGGSLPSGNGSDGERERGWH
jgi:hypothetical protein